MKKIDRSSLNPFLISLAISLAVFAIALAAFLIPVWNVTPDTVRKTVQTTGQPEVALTLATAKATPAATPSPEPASASTTDSDNGMLPVVEKVGTTEKIVCITVDDCDDADALRQILDLCENNGIKITLFPVGENLGKSDVATQIVRAYEMGMEIENHTLENARLYEVTDEEMAYQIYGAELRLCKVLGVRYQMHFLRSRDGLDKYDRRTHGYITTLGYSGMAHWSVNATYARQQQLRDALEPGAVYLFRTKQTDLALLTEFIPWALEQGYTFVTLNGLTGCPDNEVEELPPEGDDFYKVASPEPYEPDNYVELEKGLYSYDVYRLQERLLELGYLQYARATGYYGQVTVDAVYLYQAQAGMLPSGTANVQTQQSLFSDSAEEIDQSTIARYEEKSGHAYKDYRNQTEQ